MYNINLVSNVTLMLASLLVKTQAWMLDFVGIIIIFLILS